MYLLRPAEIQAGAPRGFLGRQTGAPVFLHRTLHVELQFVVHFRFDGATKKKGAQAVTPVSYTHLDVYKRQVSGPLGKRASFILDAERRDIDNGSVIDAVTLDPQTYAINPYTGVLLAPQHRLRVSPRVDYQLLSLIHI